MNKIDKNEVNSFDGSETPVFNQTAERPQIPNLRASILGNIFDLGRRKRL